MLIRPRRPGCRDVHRECDALIVDGVENVRTVAAHLGDLVNREPTIVISPTATEPVAVDTTKLTTLTGQMTIPWHDGMRRMAIARHPDLVS